MKIKLLSPAKTTDMNIIKNSCRLLKNEGFITDVATYAGGQHHYFSGKDAERLMDLQNAIDDPTVDAILCCRGGYGTIRIIDQIDFSAYDPEIKPVIGYSDITVLHCKLQSLGMTSIHGTLAFNLPENTQHSLQSLFNILKRKNNQYILPANTCNRAGKVTANIVGGNLTILSSLMGTNLELDTKNKILFIEDIDESVYAIERILWQFKKSGKFKHLQGLIVGGMTDIADTSVPYGAGVIRVITEMVREYDFPVCFDFPAGHIDDNRAILLGAEATLDVSDKQVLFSQIIN